MEVIVANLSPSFADEEEVRKARQSCSNMPRHFRLLHAALLQKHEERRRIVLQSARAIGAMCSFLSVMAKAFFEGKKHLVMDLDRPVSDVEFAFVMFVTMLFYWPIFGFVMMMLIRLFIVIVWNPFRLKLTMPELLDLFIESQQDSFWKGYPALAEQVMEALQREAHTIPDHRLPQCVEMVEKTDKDAIIARFRSLRDAKCLECGLCRGWKEKNQLVRCSHPKHQHKCCRDQPSYRG